MLFRSTCRKALEGQSRPANGVYCRSDRGLLSGGWGFRPGQVRTIFAQPNHQAARQQLAEVVKAMHTRWPKAADLLASAEEDVLAYMHFPQDHWTRIYSTNILERLIREIRRRTNVVGVFPDDPSVVRLLGTQVIEIAEDWELERRFFSLESMQRLTHPEQVLVAEPMPLRLAPVR